MPSVLDLCLPFSTAQSPASISIMAAYDANILALGRKKYELPFQVCLDGNLVD